MCLIVRADWMLETTNNRKPFRSFRQFRKSATERHTGNRSLHFTCHTTHTSWQLTFLDQMFRYGWPRRKDKAKQQTDRGGILDWQEPAMPASRAKTDCPNAKLPTCMKSRRETPLQSRCAPREISRNIDSSKALLEFFMAKYEDNSAIGIGPFSCRFQRRVGPNGQLLHPPDGQSNRNSWKARK